MSLKLRRFLSGLFVLLAAGASVAAPAFADEAPKRILSLSATGAVKAAPDEVTIATGVTSEAATAREALDKNSGAMTKVVEALKADGIEAKDIQTADFSVQPIYTERKDGVEPRIIGYRVTNAVRIVLHDPAKLGAILDKVVTLGANQIGAIDFDVAEPEALKDDARKAAMAQAIANAKLYAEAAGVTLGDVLSIAEEDGVYRTPYAAPRAMEAAKAVPIEAGTTTVEVRVHVSWELK